MRFLIFSICFCLSLAVGTEAQKPTPCVSPPLMDGIFQASLNDGVFMAQGRFVYDAYGQKLRLRTGAMINGTGSSVDQLMLFNDGVYYTIDWSKYSCTKRQLDSKFNPIQVPPKAHFQAQAVSGSSSSPGMGLLINCWAGKISEKHYYQSTFTGIGCVPLNFMSSDGTKWNFLNFINIVLGIMDPMDFIPPGFCKAAVLEDAAEPDNFFTAIRSLPKKDQ